MKILQIKPGFTFQAMISANIINGVPHTFLEFLISLKRNYPGLHRLSLLMVP